VKIIVTGGTGFVGKALLERLVRDNHEIVLLTRSPAKPGSAMPGRVTVLPWDGKSVGAWGASVEGADVIINLAGEPLDARRWTPAQKERIIASRVDAAGALRDAVERAAEKPSVVVNAAAVGFYGPVDEGDLREDAPPGQGFLAETCVRWEHAALQIGAAGPRVVVLRCGVVLGKGGGALRKMLLPFKLFVGGPLGTGRQWFPWVHRDDLVDIILFVIGRTDARGPVNVVAPEAVTMRTFCAALGAALHRPSWAPVPGLVLRAVLGEMAGMVLTGQRVVPAKLRQLGYTFRFPALAPALTDILR
jgi:uncharacterized protein (TIGR01777 family)